MAAAQAPSPRDTDGGAAQELERIEPEQSDLVARREALDQLDAALAMLDVDKRAVLVLHAIEEMTAPEFRVPLPSAEHGLLAPAAARIQLEAALRTQDRKSGVNLSRQAMRVIAGGAR